MIQKSNCYSKKQSYRLKDIHRQHRTCDKLISLIAYYYIIIDSIKHIEFHIGNILLVHDLIAVNRRINRRSKN